MYKQRSCSIYIVQRDTPPTPADLKARFHQSIQHKTQALKDLIVTIINNPSFPQMVIQVITHLIPVINQSLTIRRLLLLYWQAVDKKQADGYPREQILLSCNGLRNDLLGHNQFMRGRALRLLARMNDRSLIQPLQSAVMQNVEHKQRYVRRSALVCLYYLHQSSPQIFEDTDEIAEQRLKIQSDISTKRNAFLLLYSVSHQKALQFIQNILKGGSNQLGDVLQLAIISKFKQLCFLNPQLKQRLSKIIYNFIKDSNDSVTLQCVDALTTISNSPTTVRLSLQTLCNLIKSTTQINIKKAVVNRLNSKLYSQHRLQQLTQDLLSLLQNESQQILAQTISLLKSAISPRNFEKIIFSILSRIEKIKSIAVNDQTACLLLFAFNNFYQLKTICVQILCSTILPNAISDLGANCSRQLLYKYFNQQFDRQKFAFMALGLSTYHNHSISQAVLHLIGQKIQLRQINKCTQLIKNAVGSIPIIYENKIMQEQQQSSTSMTSKTVILKDGSYKTQVHKNVDILKNEVQNKKFRYNLIEYSKVGAMLSRTMGKILFRLKQDISVYNKEAASFLIILCNIFKLYKSQQRPIKDQSNIQTITYFIRTIIEPSKLVESIFTKNIHIPKINQSTQKIVKPPDQFLSFRQFNQSQYFLDIQDEATVLYQQQSNTYANKLSNLVQLTGYNDIIYAQAFVTINKCQVKIDILMMNRRNRPLMSVNFQFFSSAKHKILQKTASQILKPYQSNKANVVLKFEDLNFGIIHGSVSFQNNKGNQQQYLHTSKIYLNILDYIYPNNISLTEFISKWQNYQWENKTTISYTPQKKEFTLSKIINKLKAFIVSQSADNPIYHVINLAGKSSTQNDFICCMSITQGQIKKEVNLKLRSQSKGLVDAIGRQIAQSFM